MKKSIFFKFAILIFLMPFVLLCGCSKKDNQPVQDDATEKTSEQAAAEDESKIGCQLDLPQKGEEIAVIKTTVGDIKLRFFEEEAPKACENFKTLAKDGFYNGIIFHRVIHNFMIQTGDPNGDGTGGKSIWNQPFEDEFSDHLLNISYSVAMANGGKNTNGSQFFINQVRKENFIGFEKFEEAYEEYKKNPEKFNEKYSGTVDMSKVGSKMKKLYSQNGGNPHLDGFYNTNNQGHTVFAQVFEGKDVVDKIASVKTEKNDKPVKNITIKSIEILGY